MIARENVSLPKIASTRGGVVEEPFLKVDKGVGVSTVVTGGRLTRWMEVKWTADNSAAAGEP